MSTFDSKSPEAGAEKEEIAEGPVWAQGKKTISESFLFLQHLK